MRALLLLLLLVVSLPAHALQPWRGGAVATQHALATEAAVAMLEKGGSAADAAVAAAFVLAVAAPYHSGLGGGGFAVVHEVSGKGTWALDFREVAPLAATRDMYLRDGKAVPALSRDGGLAVAVPGAVAGYLALHERAGKLSLKQVMAPALRVANEGFHVTPNYLRMASRREACLAEYGAGRVFLADDGKGGRKLPEVSARIRQPELAHTLHAISEGGAASFYTGRIARQLVEGVRKAGGILSMQDLVRYRVREVTPLMGTFRGHRIATFPPPSAGGVTLLQTLGVLERAFPEGTVRKSPELLHVYIEALRRAHLDRLRYMGDPAFNDLPITRLLSDAHLSAMLADIDRKAATRSEALIADVPGLKGLPPDTGKKNTSHLSVVDREGNAVVLTTTVNTWFGSCVMPEGTGVVMNNEMNDFTTQPWAPNAFGLVTGAHNAIEPGKIPLSSMTPTLVFQKDAPTQVLLALGSPGGSTIPTTVLQTLLAVVDHRMDVARAVSEGRLHHQLLPDEVRVDQFGLEPATFQALEALGHRMVQVDGAWGDAEAVYVDPASGLRTAASDPRGEGAAGGHH
ncbi:MAG TPA: gamma-glutamyltransferase [Myxococcaceae bacterium]|nr:gamma-glutamyltransferase [Myxococcaceae bacterium]